LQTTCTAKTARLYAVTGRDDYRFGSN
jgi:hypothetical protein